MNHDKNLIAFMRRAEERKLKLNPEKIQFKLTKIAFMGFRISEAGVEPDPTWIKAIVEMPRPVNKHGVQRFIGMVNFLNAFYPSLASVIKPLHNLTRPHFPVVISS